MAIPAARLASGVRLDVDLADVVSAGDARRRLASSLQLSVCRVCLVDSETGQVLDDASAVCSDIQARVSVNRKP